METPRPKLPLATIVVYLFAVVACIFLAFDFDGAINTNWTIVLIGLTLPWSLISIVFAWALIHGPALGFYTTKGVAAEPLNA
jgi:hypothetical protein